ncbi:MAG: cytochrome c oxidase subunit 4 [Flavobacteriales bacterium]|jgi:cytochrome c oxidase subunit 4|tara:strand:+ start:2756 stop:3139 length:384 start_codon:yes stop_codon:yes gene_type:complete
MAQDGHTSTLLFGLVKPKNNVSKIWWVFGFLSIITIVEVALGIAKPESLHLTSFLGTSPLNWIFLILTLVKAYGITWAFMHMDGEKKWFRRAIVWTTIFLICYLTLILLIEGDYLYSVLSPYVKWEY